MKIKIWPIAIGIYIAVMITYHRFENSKLALEILGDIPTLLSAITTAGAFWIAAITYTSNARRTPSKEAFEVYKETLNELKTILRSDTEGKDYKLYHVGVSFDALANLHNVVTEPDHRSTLLVKLVPIKHEIERLLKTYAISDYFLHDIEHNEEYNSNVSSSADAFYNYWLVNIRGKSSCFKKTDGKIDFFASYPFGIDDELLIKALAMCSQNLDLFSVKHRISGVLKVVVTQEFHELVELAGKLPLVVSYLLLKNQTEPYLEDGQIKLRLKGVFNEELWLQYKMYEGAWCTFKVPEKLRYKNHSKKDSQCAALAVPIS